jgi:hypothetical protein
MPPDFLVSRGSKASRPWCRLFPKGIVEPILQSWTRRVDSFPSNASQK